MLKVSVVGSFSNVRFSHSIEVSVVSAKLTLYPRIIPCLLSSGTRDQYTMILVWFTKVPLKFAGGFDGAGKQKELYKAIVYMFCIMTWNEIV